VLVFLHGFNNTFEDVAKRAAQIGADLGVPPNDMFLFSWASMNSIPTYPIDEATIDASEVFLKQFLGTVIKAAHGRTIHIIAHSMGNRAMLRVANEIAAETKPGQPKPFGQIFLASADVDSELFDDLGAAFTKIAHRTTIYLSPYDFAVYASTHIHDYPRVGCGSVPQSWVPGIESVVSTLPDEIPGHAYIAERIPLLNDVKNLILRDDSPRPAPEWTHEDGYWRVGPPVNTLETKALACPSHPLYRIPEEASK
jgi:pimeloyl-ACP methyl ester carboxylesterase